MTAQTKIEWAHHSFSPWIGCTKISAGCAGCYAEWQMAARTKMVEWGKGAPRKPTSNEYWIDALRWDADAKKKGVRYRVFPSLCDPFDEEVPDEWRDKFFMLIGATPHLDWMLLTKRPRKMLEYMGQEMVLRNHAITSEARIVEGGKLHRIAQRYLEARPALNLPYWPNVWLGVSVEDQKTAEQRIPLLLQAQAPVRFLSVEPQLESIDLSLQDWQRRNLASTVDPFHFPPVTLEGFALDMVIVGGESTQGGHKARPFHVEWAREIVAQCAEAKLRCFVKQLGSNPILDGAPLKLVDRKGGDMSEWPADIQVRQMARGVR